MDIFHTNQKFNIQKGSWIISHFCAILRHFLLWCHQWKSAEGQNAVNMISQEGRLWQFSKLVHRCPILWGRTLLFLVGVKCHLGSPRSNPANLVNTISWGRKLGWISYFSMYALWLEKELYYFWRRSKVIWVHQGSKLENFVKQSISW